jgi:hypothetical protein
MLQSRSLLLGAALAVLIGALVLLAPRSAASGGGYTEALDQPCIACHVTGTSPDLNARGLAFASVEGHQGDPAAAWAIAVQQVPLEPSTDGGFPGVVVPVAVLALVLAWAYSMLRRRRSPG